MLNFYMKGTNKRLTFSTTRVHTPNIYEQSGDKEKRLSIAISDLRSCPDVTPGQRPGRERSVKQLMEKIRDSHPELYADAQAALQESQRIQNPDPDLELV